MPVTSPAGILGWEMIRGLKLGPLSLASVTMLPGFAANATESMPCMFAVARTHKKKKNVSKIVIFSNVPQIFFLRYLVLVVLPNQSRLILLHSSSSTSCSSKDERREGGGLSHCERVGEGLSVLLPLLVVHMMFPFFFNFFLDSSF
jgi:hypothetical protein